jgi:hypothetical protein
MSGFLNEAPFRIRSPKGRIAQTKEVAPAAVQAEPDPYFARLVKLVPAEVLALFVTFKQAAVSFLGTWSLICLVLVVIVRTIGNKQAGKPIQWIAVAVATISFGLWVYATGGHLGALKLPNKPEAEAAVSIAIGVWTFVVPYFYKGDES